MKNLVVVAVAAMLAACATMPYQPYAREVKKKPQEGGLIALKSEHRPEDRQKAEGLMQANCGSQSIAKVMEEGEVVTGERTNSNASKTQESAQSSLFSIGGIKFGSTKPSENTNTTTVTEQMKEWQIAYECVAIKAPASSNKKPISRK